MKSIEAADLSTDDVIVLDEDLQAAIAEKAPNATSLDSALVDDVEIDMNGDSSTLWFWVGSRGPVIATRVKVKVANDYEFKLIMNMNDDGTEE